METWSHYYTPGWDVARMKGKTLKLKDGRGTDNSILDNLKIFYVNHFFGQIIICC